MECALCTNAILMEETGFAQLPCKHTFHIRCMVPACRGFWGTEQIACKICLAEQTPIAANAVQPIVGRNLTVDDAYELVADVEEKMYDRKVSEHAKKLTDAQKKELKLYVQTCRQAKKLNIAFRGELNKRHREFMKNNNHLITALNNSYRKLVNDLFATDVCNSYKKILKKNNSLNRRLTNQLTNNDEFRLMDICMALKMKRIPFPFNYDLCVKRAIRFRFYRIPNMLFDIKNLDKPKY